MIQADSQQVRNTGMVQRELPSTTINQLSSFSLIIEIKVPLAGAEEIAHWLRMLATLPRDAGSMPSIHIAANKPPIIPLPGKLIFSFWPPQAPDMYVVHSHTYR